jgi:catechol 2,3-dioxygenase-like lactoylglutathione lyase family enzyme
MIHGALPTLFVSDMDLSVAFYTQTLGLALAFRAGDHWAQIDAGDGTAIGLHPRSDQAPEPGTVGAISVGLNVDESIEGVIATLVERGVEFPQGVSSDGMLRIAHFADPDGNPLYLCEQPQWGA